MLWGRRHWPKLYKNPAHLQQAGSRLCRRIIPQSSLLQAKEGFHSIFQPFLIHRLAFPNHQYFPALFLEKSNLSAIPQFVLIELVLPKLRVGRGGRRLLASRMSMPEASVDEDGNLQFRQNNVRCPRQVSPVDAKSTPHAMEQPAQQDFWSGIPSANKPHQLRSAILTDDVHCCSSAPRPVQSQGIILLFTIARDLRLSCDSNRI